MNWRTSGDTTEEAFRRLIPEHSEIFKRGEVGAVYRAGRPYTRLMAGMLAAESSYATDFNAVQPEMNNPLNMRVRRQPQFQEFPTIAASIYEWKARITDPIYAYRDTETVAELVAVYAPSSDNNDEAKYVATVERVINALPKLEEPVSIPVSAPPVQISITPMGPNRPALAMASPSYITVHEVGNQSPGADEEMHRRFVHNGGGPNQVSFHFVVGPTKVIQLLPLDEAAWHASDGYSGTGNRDSIAIETIQIGDFNRTLWHLAWLINEIATNPTRFFRNMERSWDMSINRIKQHYDWAPDKKNCPEFIRNRGLWPELMRRVDLWNAAGQEIELPAEDPDPQPEPVKHEIPTGKTEALLRRQYGTALNPVTKEMEGFDLDFAPSQVWLAYGKRTGRWPELRRIIRRGDGGLVYQWTDGFDWERKAPGVD